MNVNVYALLAGFGGALLGYLVVAAVEGVMHYMEHGRYRHHEETR